MRNMSTAFKGALSLLAVLFVVGTAGIAVAQVPSANPPFNVDLGAVITNNVQIPATVNSAQKSNLDKSGIICTFNATLSSGSPSITFNIQNFDSASNSYYTIATSGAQQAFSYNVPLSIFVREGAQLNTALPASILSGSGVPVARFWRLQEVITGANTATTSTIGCNQLK